MVVINQEKKIGTKNNHHHYKTNIFPIRFNNNKKKSNKNTTQQTNLSCRHLQDLNQTKPNQTNSPATPLLENILCWFKNIQCPSSHDEDLPTFVTDHRSATMTYEDLLQPMTSLNASMIMG